MKNYLILFILFSFFSCGNESKNISSSASKADLSDTNVIAQVKNQIFESDTLEFASLKNVKRLTNGINNPKSVIISPNGLYAYINNLEGMNTMIINTETYDTVKVIQHTGKPVEFGITDSGRFVWISYFRLMEKGYPRELGQERSYRYKSIVVVYDTLSQELVQRIEVGIIPKVIAVSPDEKLILVANWNSYDITVIENKTYNVIKTIKVGVIPRGVKFTPDGKFAYVCNFGGSTISKINITDLEVEKTITNVGYKPRDLVITNDGKYAYFSCFGDGYLRKLDLETDKVVDKIRTGSEPRSICITRNNKYLFVTNYKSANISVIDVDNFKLLNNYSSDVGAVGVALTLDMKHLWVTNQRTGSVIIYEIHYK
ncbi:MAG TPA: YncE family protein [Ignavibacteria bacterium]